MDERVLIGAACRGDARSFNRLVCRHQNAAYSVAYHLLGRADAAADALEEALLAAYRALPALRGAPLEAWLLRRVVDACRRRARPGQGGVPVPPGNPAPDASCLNTTSAPLGESTPSGHGAAHCTGTDLFGGSFWRSGWSMAARKTPSGLEPDGCGAGEPAVAGCLGAKDGWRIDAQETSLDPDLVQAIEAGIGSLPFESRAVLVLADVQGLSHEEIAQVTGAAPAVVGRRLAEARVQLRDWLYGSAKGTLGAE